MLSKISWYEYAILLLTALVLYYAFIGLKYFLPEIKGFFTTKLQKRPDKESSAPLSENTNEYTSFEFLEDVIRDLRYAVIEKFSRPSDKPALLEALKKRLADYPGLEKPAFKYAINNYIIVHAKEICGVVFSEDELNGAWEALLRKNYGPRKSGRSDED